jgi:hypothetical protein
MWRDSVRGIKGVDARGRQEEPMTRERETSERVEAGLHRLRHGLTPFVDADTAAWPSRAEGAVASAPLDEHGLLKTMLDKWNAVFALPDGSIVKLIEVKSVPVRKRRVYGQYYVEIELKNGLTHCVVEHLSKEEAGKKQAEIIKAIQEAWDEFTPYDVGHEAGRVRGHAEGWSEGFEKGHSEGWSEGVEQGRSEGQSVGTRIGEENGRSEERQYVLGVLLQQRERLLNEQQSASQLPPSRRRYLRDAISVLSDLMRELTPEPTPDPEAAVTTASPER